MATWGEFKSEVNVVQMKTGMYVLVDEVIDLWEERNKLRTEVEQLKEELNRERAACAQEVEDFAKACEEESCEPDLAAVLRAAATLIRDRAQEEASGPVPDSEGEQVNS